MDISVLCATICAALAPDAPDFPRELGTARRRRRVDDFDGCGRFHRVGLAFHAEHRRHPLRQRSRALASRVELVRTDSQPGALHNHANNRVAGAAGPSQVAGRIIVFVPVNVMDFDVARRSAEYAEARA